MKIFTVKTHKSITSFNFLFQGEDLQDRRMDQNIIKSEDIPCKLSCHKHFKRKKKIILFFLVLVFIISISYIHAFVYHVGVFSTYKH